MLKVEKSAGSYEFALLLLLGILWGIPYGLTKISLTTIPPMTLTAVRVVVAAATLWAIVFASGCKLPARRDFIPRMLLQGCISCVIPYAFIAFGQQTVPSALTAILNSTGPLFVCCLLYTSWHRFLSRLAAPAKRVHLCGIRQACPSW